MTGKELLPLIKAEGRADRYSRNLFKWIWRHGGTRRLFVAFATEGRKTYDPAKTQAGNLYIGFHGLDKGWLHGARLSEVLCIGPKASTFAYPPKMRFVIVSGWFEGYINGGKCFIDPEHTLYYDAERWNEQGDTRVCRWCNSFTQKKEIVMTPHETWRPLHTAQAI